jgi:hypothetical protein
MLNLKKLRNTRTAAAWRCMHRNYRREGQASQKLTSALSRHFRAVSDIAGERRERKGTVWHKRSNICGGVVQLVRTPYSHPEQQDHERDFHSSRGARPCGNRCEWSADEVVSWLDRIAANRRPPATNENAKQSDVFRQSLEQRDVLCSQNEHSDVVWNSKTLL